MSTNEESNLEKMDYEKIIDGYTSELDRYIRPINGYSKYVVTRWGDIYRGNDLVKSKIHEAHKVPVVSLENDAGNWSVSKVGVVVYTSFIGKFAGNKRVSYVDDNCNNNHLDNLVLVNYGGYDENNIKRNERRRKLNEKPLLELDATKEWRPMRGFEECYKISNYGDVYSIQSNIMMKLAANDDGYKIFNIKIGDGKKKIYIHMKVYETFNDTDCKKGMVIDHINRIRDDNRVENLREITYSENAKNRNKPTARIPKIRQYGPDGIYIKEWESIEKIKENDINVDEVIKSCVKIEKTTDGYIWRYDIDDECDAGKNGIINDNYDENVFYDMKYDDGGTYSKYKVNKLGQIKNYKGLIMSQHINGGYKHISLYDDLLNLKVVLVHRIVALTFIENPENKEVVNHKDRNKLNNHCNNLEWMTEQENIRHACARKVNKINPVDKTVIKTYDCIVDAYGDLGLTAKTGSISSVCKGKQKTAYGYEWQYAQ